MSDKKKADYGKGRTPGHFCVLPQRAVIDKRFKTYPRTFMILAALGNYTSRQGVCWPNQITIAKNLHITQSTVSRHIKKLIEWDYIRYAKKHPGLKGNKYFMVFDPKIKEEDALAMVPDKDRSYEDKPEIHVGPKGGDKKKYAPRVHKTVVKNSSNMVSSTYPDMQSEYMHNNPKNNHIYPIVRNILNRFVRITEEIFGTLVQYTTEDEKMVSEWVKEGLTEARAAARIKEILLWRRNNRKECPKRIVFYKDVFFRKPKPTTNKELVQDILKKVVRSTKIR
jgi:DNA-binding transcriptional regulator GbsR (MarR family)|tara:strand:- start:175 stop:1017 length:843 start_codon:yes stop_codon:yes gene_type:complete